MSKIKTTWIREKEESVEVQYANKKFVASVGFIVSKTSRKWETDYKEFNNAKHLDNYISVMERKGYKFDEVWIRD